MPAGSCGMTQGAKAAQKATSAETRRPMRPSRWAMSLRAVRAKAPSEGTVPAIAGVLTA
jgi:hypothetical protein